MLYSLLQGQRWSCPSYNPRTTALVPYSFKDVSLGAQVASSHARPYLLFFRQVAHICLTSLSMPSSGSDTRCIYAAGQSPL